MSEWFRFAMMVLMGIGGFVVGAFWGYDKCREYADRVLRANGLDPNKAYEVEYEQRVKEEAAIYNEKRRMNIESKKNKKSKLSMWQRLKHLLLK